MIRTSTKQQKLYSGKFLYGIFTALLCTLFLGNIAKAQLIYTESFESTPMVNTQTLSLGWAQGKYGAGTDPDNYWDRRTMGQFPIIPPRTGSAMMRYLSWSITAGEASFLASKRLDMRLMPAGGTNCSFWMYRDNGWAGYPDRVQVYLNTTPDMGGTPVGPLNEVGSGSNFISRDCAMAPIAGTCNAWNQYIYNIPQLGNNHANLYVVIVATSGFGNDIHIDDFVITTYPQAQAYTAASAAVFTQNTNTTGPNQPNQQIIGVRFTMDGATTPKTLTQMQFNTNGSSNPPTDITNAKLWFSGGSNTFSTDNAILMGTYNQPWGTNDTFLLTSAWPNYSGMASFSGLEHGVNHFWLTYNIAPGAVAGNYVDGEWLDFELNGVAAATTVPNPLTLPGARLIDLVYCVPPYIVGTIWLGYVTNDFINSVNVVGDNLPPPGIQNNQNWILIPAGPNCPAPAPRNCPFQTHPPDYEAFAEVAGKTTAFTADGTTVYPITTQVGTYGGGNVIAAWIDYNKDGVFNNWFVEVTVNASGAAATPTITLAGVVTHPGWKVGMNVTGTGIGAGATIVNVVGTTVTLSVNNAGPVSGGILFTTPDGEKISQSQGLGALGSYVTSFKVPNTAVSGKTRLRVREVWIDYNIDPCNLRTYGEAEDYTVTIIPDCPGYPGYTTWLGLTSNWADPSNWCPAIAPINPNIRANVRIPGGPSGAYTYVRPIITAGIQAWAKNLRIEANDTIYVDATTGAYLDVQDSLKIWTPTSALKINTTFIDTAQVLNGTLNRPADSPLGNNQKIRAFMLFNPTELTSQGLAAGDKITDIFIHMQRKSGASTIYKNFTVKMYYCTAPAVLSAGFGLGPGTPPPTAAAPGPITVWSGDLNIATYIPAVNGYGTITLPLIAPYINTGVNQLLCVEYCFDNTGFPNTSANEEIRFTQTSPNRYHMQLKSAGTKPTAGCSLVSSDFSTIAVTWVLGSPNITIPAASAPLTYIGQIVSGGGFPGGTTVIAGAGTTNLTLDQNAIAPSNTANHTFFNVTYFNQAQYRPNVTFKFDRPYKNFPIYVGGHWENNGTFIAAKSNVIMSGVGSAGSWLNQQISGTATTTFYNLYVSNPNHVMRISDFVVTDSLALGEGRLKLNNGLVTLTNPQITSVTRSDITFPAGVVSAGTGYIQAETDALAANAFPYGRIRWQMGSTPGMRIIPFANPSNVPVFMDYNVDSGTHDVILGTFNTLPTNINLPTPEVTNIYGFNGSAWNSDGSSTADRFFLVKDSLGASPQADITFRWATSERSANNPTGALPMSAQRWISATDVWEFPYVLPQVYTTDQIVVSNYTQFSTTQWWVPVGTTTPLPVTMLEFTAKQFKDKVRLNWTTASEINNSHFDVERTIDNSAFDFIGTVQSRGPGNNLQEYELWDNDPRQGTQYYYLRQYDYDGKLTSFGPVSANFNKDLFDIITTTISPSEHGLTVVFNYNTTQPFSYRIMDMTGRIIVAKDRNPGVEGVNVLDIDATLSKGAYHIVLQNNEKVVSRQFFY